MDITEIRIGNYVLDKHGDFHIIGINCFQRFRHPTMDCNPSGFKPILINEDWLINLGFNKEHKSEFSIKYTHKEKHEIGYDWGKSSGWEFRYYGNYIECKYIHNLQNIFYALTKMELTKEQL